MEYFGQQTFHLSTIISADTLRACHQTPLLILGEFKKINKFLLPLKSSENQKFSDDFIGDRNWETRLN